ncbi:MAG: hypothetical protein FJ011_25335 [Chloroflexi bacterium]|nr:hypothetical protein [Chloroflexota bacterium]
MRSSFSAWMFLCLTGSTYSVVRREILDGTAPLYRRHTWAYELLPLQPSDLGAFFPGLGAEPWVDQEIAVVHEVGRRVGGKMDLMLDPSCNLDTFGAAIKVGWACDEERFFWLEDPYKDGGISQFAHRKLRQIIKTPLLQREHMRTLEPHIRSHAGDRNDR